jgi:hypothetical protein
VNVPCPLSAKLIHSAGNDGADSRASPDNDEFLFRFRGHGAQRLLPSMLENKENRFPKARQTLFACRALAVGARDFGTVCDVPGRVLFNNCRKLVTHELIVAPVYRVRLLQARLLTPREGIRLESSRPRPRERE